MRKESHEESRFQRVAPSHCLLISLTLFVHSLCLSSLRGAAPLLPIFRSLQHLSSPLSSLSLLVAQRQSTVGVSYFSSSSSKVRWSVVLLCGAGHALRAIVGYAVNFQAKVLSPRQSNYTRLLRDFTPVVMHQGIQQNSLLSQIFQSVDLTKSSS